MRVGALAKLLEIHRQTIQKAIKREEIPYEADASGAKMVREKDVRTWMKRERNGVGRPPTYGE